MMQLISEQELSKITGRALQTLRNDRHLRRGFPYIRLRNGGRGQIRYDMQDVEEYLRKNRIDPEEG